VKLEPKVTSPTFLPEPSKNSVLSNSIGIDALQSDDRGSFLQSIFREKENFLLKKSLSFPIKVYFFFFSKA